MKIYTIYDHPTDFPNEYIVRVDDVSTGDVINEGIIKKDTDLEEIRDFLRKKGVEQMPIQDPNPVILESWM